MKLTRREFIKNNAIAATAAAAGVTLPGVQQALAAGDADIRWDKAPCRFCGTGCSVLVGVKGNEMVASQGDPDAPVNRGLNCIKGYFLSKIMYGKDRLTRPLLRKKNGVYDKNGDFLDIPANERVIGIKKEELKSLQGVVGVACGARKGRAILGAARGGIINSIVTDEAAALNILSELKR